MQELGAALANSPGNKPDMAAAGANLSAALTLAVDAVMQEKTGVLDGVVLLCDQGRNR